MGYKAVVAFFVYGAILERVDADSVLGDIFVIMVSMPRTPQCVPASLLIVVSWPRQEGNHVENAVNTQCSLRE
jgi:hypothetical protein